MGITFRTPQHWLSTSVEGVPRALEAKLLKTFGTFKAVGDRGRAIDDTLYVNVEGVHYTKASIQNRIREAVFGLGVSSGITMITKDFWALPIEVSPAVHKTAQEELSDMLALAPTVAEVAWLNGSELIVWTELPPEKPLQDAIRRMIQTRLPRGRG